MSEVAAIVEGQTEHTFVRDHLATHLEARRVTIWPRLPGRIARRGGVRSWEQVRGDIIRTLRERPGRFCTTMFDFYAMPHDWPGRREAAAMRTDTKGGQVEHAMLDDLAQCAGLDFRRELFIPYVQVHEFEALLFADVERTAEALAPICGVGADRLRSQLDAVLQAAGQPEAINDGYQTCPSRQISSRVPAYRKALYGPIIAGRIGLGAMRQACPHFGHWLERLEGLGPGGTGV